MKGMDFLMEEYNGSILSGASVCYFAWYECYKAMLQIRIKYTGSGVFWTSGSGVGKKLNPDSGTGILDEHPRSLFRELRNSLKVKNT